MSNENKGVLEGAMKAGRIVAAEMNRLTDELAKQRADNERLAGELEELYRRRDEWFALDNRKTVELVQLRADNERLRAAPTADMIYEGARIIREFHAIPESVARVVYTAMVAACELTERKVTP